MKRQVYTLNNRGKGDLSTITASDLYLLVNETINSSSGSTSSGTTVDQNNYFKIVTTLVHNQTFDYQTMLDNVNAQSFIIKEKEILLINCYHLAGVNGLFVYRFIAKNGKGKGNYGVGGTILSLDDIEQISFEKHSGIINVILPNTDIFNLNNLSGLTLSNYINQSQPPYIFQPQNEGYTIINISGTTELSFLYIGAGGVYGLNTGQTTTLNFQLLSSNLEEIGDTIIGTYGQIKTLKDNYLLISGKKYLITDYKTEYIIEGSESGASQLDYTSITAVSGYAQFPIIGGAYPVGTSVTLIALPSGYSGPAVVGMTSTISTVFGTQYYIFSGQFPELAGMTVRFNKPRYSSEFNNITITDVNGKIIIQENGVVNTDVHLGDAYSDMTSNENPLVPIEEILLTAKSNNSFYKNAISNTFDDILEYDFDDNIVKNSNNLSIKNRTGFITRRTNETLNISIDKDWRVQRYRRYMMSPNHYNLMKRQQPLYQVNITGSTTPYFGGLALGSFPNINNRYALLEVENPNYWLDFTSGGTISNVFISGSTLPVNRTVILNDEEYRFSIPFNLSSNTVTFKDFFIIPTTNGEITNVEKVKIDELTNTVFLKNNTSYGISVKHNIKASNIKNSTIITGSYIYSTGLLENLKLFNESVIYNKNGSMKDYTSFIFHNITNYGTIFNLVLGGGDPIPGGGQSNINITVDSDTKIFNSIIASIINMNTYIHKSTMNSCILFNPIALNIWYTLNGYLTSVVNPIPGFNSDVVDNYATYNTEFDIRTGFLPNPNKAANTFGWSYVVPKVINYKIKTKSNNTKALYYEKFDEFDAITITTISTPS